MELSLEKIKKVADSDTSADPEHWIEDNPLWGHCAVVALIVQDFYGGTLMRGSLSHIPKYAFLRSHFWNKLPDGREIDFTEEQYADLSFHDLKGEERDRESVLSHPDTVRRYNLLKQRLEEGS